MDKRTLRIYIYSLIVAAGPLVSFYGLMGQDEIALWIGLGGTILGVPGSTIALSNLTPKEADELTIDDEVLYFADPEEDDLQEDLPGKHADV